MYNTYLQKLPHNIIRSPDDADMFFDDTKVWPDFDDTQDVWVRILRDELDL